MSTLKVTNVAHETSTLNTLVFDNGGGSGNGRVTTKGTIGEISAVSYASTITLDFRTANNFSTTLTGNVTFANPSNISAGQSGVLFITQDGTGSRTAAFGSYWDFSVTAQHLHYLQEQMQVDMLLPGSLESSTKYFCTVCRKL